MNTRQDKIPQVLLRGFSINKPSQKSLFPRTALTAFLNVDVKKTSEIDKYCQDYNYLPSGDLSTFYKNFSREQKAIRKIADKLLDNSFSVEDSVVVNTALEKVHPQLLTVSEKEIKKFNKELGAFEAEGKGQNDYYVLAEVYGSTNISMWYELAKRIEKSDLSQCLNCGKFIMISLSVQQKKYCDDYCKNSYHQRKRRRKRTV